MDTRHIALQASGLFKDFAHRTVLRRIDLEVDTGRVVALMGANGAGKTTLLGCLATIVRPSSGDVSWFGHPAGGNPRRRCLLGVVSHESRLYPHLSLRENLVFTGRMYGVANPRKRADRQLAEIGLTSYADRLAGEVSRGMRQRVAVSRALVHEPRILLLDEPFSGLDTQAADWLTETLKRRREAGCAICLTTHDAARAARLADQVWELREGRLYDASRELLAAAAALVPTQRAA